LSFVTSTGVAFNAEMTVPNISPATADRT
jgi:hypothetical protein